jgi:hypothetical protein
MRAAVSAAPPAANPTTMVTVFFGGKSCACACKPIVLMTLMAPIDKATQVFKKFLLCMVDLQSKSFTA